MTGELWVRDRTWTWHDRLRDEAPPVWLSLDPADADHGPPARVTLVSGGVVRAWRFIGSTDPGADPIGLVCAAWSLLNDAPPGTPILAPPVRESPVHRHLALSLAQALRPERIVVPRASGLERWPWPVGAEEADATPDLPPLVRDAQRRARWLELRERATSQIVPLDTVGVLGARFGSGHRFRTTDWEGHAEAGAGTLLLIGDGEPDEAAGTLMAQSQASRMVVNSPRTYDGLVCAFAHQDGEDFAMGIVDRLDLERREFTVLSDAVPPAPVRLLRLGRLRVDGSGREVGEAKPWTV